MTDLDCQAIVRNPDIFLFDEATSALDTESETVIQQAIRELSRDKTVVMTAHRLSTIKWVDRIYVVEDGRIAEEGSYDELIPQKGLLSSLSHNQTTGQTRAG